MQVFQPLWLLVIFYDWYLISAVHLCKNRCLKRPGPIYWFLLFSAVHHCDFFIYKYGHFKTCYFKMCVGETKINKLHFSLFELILLIVQILGSKLHLIWISSGNQACSSQTYQTSSGACLISVFSLFILSILIRIYSLDSNWMSDTIQIVRNSAMDKRSN